MPADFAGVRARRIVGLMLSACSSLRSDRRYRLKLAAPAGLLYHISGGRRLSHSTNADNKQLTSATCERHIRLDVSHSTAVACLWRIADRTVGPIGAGRNSSFMARRLAE